MLRQFLLGGLVSLLNISIHALVMTTVVRVAHRARSQNAVPTFRLIIVMIAVVSVLMAAHACEVMVWALSYLMVGVAPDGAKLVYFAFVNYPTLGYGDVVPLEKWQ